MFHHFYQSSSFSTKHPAGASFNWPLLRPAVGAARLGVLLLIVVLAVQLPVPEVAAGGEGLLTHGALQTLLVPGRVVDPHQEAVGDGPLAALTHRRVVAVGSWRRDRVEARQSGEGALEPFH